MCGAVVFPQGNDQRGEESETVLNVHSNQLHSKAVLMSLKSPKFVLSYTLKL